MYVIRVRNDYDPNAELLCDCGTWKQRADNDIEVMAKSINHIREVHDGEGAIEFPRKFIVVTYSSITVLEKS